MCSINAICPDSPSQTSIHSTHFVIDTSSIEGGQKTHYHLGWLQDFKSKWSLLKQKIIYMFTGISKILLCTRTVLVNVYFNCQCLNIANRWTNFILIDRRTLTSYLTVSPIISAEPQNYFFFSPDLRTQQVTGYHIWFFLNPLINLQMLSISRGKGGLYCLPY